jgi:hypothetical protein
MKALFKVKRALDSRFLLSQDNSSGEGVSDSPFLGLNNHFLLNCFPNSSMGRIKKMGRPWGQVVER